MGQTQEEDVCGDHLLDMIEEAEDLNVPYSYEPLPIPPRAIETGD